MIELEIERVALGGDGVARAPDGRVVFVRQALAGDRWLVELTEVARRHARGVGRTRLRQGPDQRAVPCAVHADCGGCPWMALQPEVQRAALRVQLQQLFDRTLKEASVPVAPIEAAPPEWGWRSTTRMHWREGALGYYRAGSHELCEIPRCVVLSPPLDRAHALIRAQLAPQLEGAGSLRLSADDQAAVLALSPQDPLAEAQAQRLDYALAQLVAHSAGAIRGALRLEGRRTAARFGAPTVFLGPHRVAHDAQAFMQGHQAGNAQLIEAVRAALEGQRHVLELFAGSGNLTIPLALSGLRLSCVEWAAAGVAALRQTLRERGLSAQVAVFEGDAARLPAGAFDAALIDPPRSGAAQAVAALHQTSIERLVYVACEPQTLARDLAWLCARGWRVVSLRAFDLFAHTGHVEVLAQVVRR